MKTLAAAFALVVLAACGSAAASAERMIEKQGVVKAPIAEVWKAWTTREGIRSFFAPDANVEPRSGGPFEIIMNPYAEPGMKGADDMRVMAVQEPTMLSFTWNAPPHQPEIRAQRTLVIVRLKPVDERSTEVTIHHLGWGEGEKWNATYAYFDRAWGNVLANLQKRFVDGPVDFTPFLEQLRAGAGAPKK
jgi:uncharacterized protein YndB with AHSA1/START domain